MRIAQQILAETSVPDRVGGSKSEKHLIGKANYFQCKHAAHH